MNRKEAISLVLFLCSIHPAAAINKESNMSMAGRNTFVLVATFATLWLLGGCGSPPADAVRGLLGVCGKPSAEVQVAPELTPKTSLTIVVLPFQQSDSKPDHLETLWQDTSIRDSGNLVSDMFTTELMRVPGFKLVERSQIQKVLQEQDLSLSDLLARKTAQEIGHLLGVDAVVGTVADFRHGSPPLSGWSDYSYSMRMVDAKTGAVLISTQTSEHVDQYDVSKRCCESVHAVVDKILEKLK